MLTAIPKPEKDSIVRRLIGSYDQNLKQKGSKIDVATLDLDIGQRVVHALHVGDKELLTDERQTVINAEVQEIRERVYQGLNLARE